MIRVTIRKAPDGTVRALDCEGHAAYAEYGNDVVCAAISMLVLNTLNSIESLTDNPFQGDEDKKKGKISVVFPEGLDQAGMLLMDSLRLGVCGVEEQYGKEYVSFSEVTE